MANNKKNEAITARDVDFAKWYTDVCRKAELMDYSGVKGFIIYRPYGYALWEQIQNHMDKKFKDLCRIKNIPKNIRSYIFKKSINLNELIY